MPGLVRGPESAHALPIRAFHEKPGAQGDGGARQADELVYGGSRFSACDRRTADCESGVPVQRLVVTADGHRVCRKFAAWDRATTSFANYFADNA